MHVVTLTRPATLKLPPALVALAVVALVAALLFRAEIAAAVSVWIESTAYNHCFLVLPVVGWLLWRRRDEFVALTPTGALPGLLLFGAAACLWWIGVRAGVMELRQLAAMAMVQAALLACLGWRPYARFAAEFGYLVFAVPFGAFLHEPLQHWTAAFIGVGLDALHIPYWADGFSIDIAEGRFVVEEACSGLRFLIASIAFGALFAHLNFVSAWRKAAFLAASVVIPVVMNGLRALGIVLVGHWAGSAEAAAADHVIYGTVFFATVIAVMVLVGQAFSDRSRNEAASAVMRDAAPGTVKWRRFAVLLAIAAALALLHDMPARELVTAEARLVQAGEAPVVLRAVPYAQWEVGWLGKDDSVRVAAATSYGDLRVTDAAARPLLWFVDGEVRRTAPGARERLAAALRLKRLFVVVLLAPDDVPAPQLQRMSDLVAQSLRD